MYGPRTASGASLDADRICKCIDRLTGAVEIAAADIGARLSELAAEADAAATALDKTRVVIESALARTAVTA